MSNRPLGPVVPTGPINLSSTIILTLGPNLVGKGANGKFLAEHLSSLNGVPHDNSRHFSLGEYLRDLRKDDRIFEESYGAAISRGELLPNEVVDGIVKKRIHKMKFGVCDGYPRNSHQARKIIEIFSEWGGNVIAVEFMASLACSQIRAVGRGRGDDDPKVVTMRFQNYMRNRPGVLGTLAYYGIPIHRHDVMEHPNVTPIRNFQHFLNSLGIPQEVEEIGHGREVTNPIQIPIRAGNWMTAVPGMIPAVA